MYIDCLDGYLNAPNYLPTCVPWTMRLDGKNDCPVTEGAERGVDEECYPEQTYCDRGKCVPDELADEQCADRRRTSI